MFMRHPAYLGEDSGNQAIAGESSRILKQFWGNRKIVSHWLSETPNPLPHTRLELEARVEIDRVSSSTSHSKSIVYGIAYCFTIKELR
jgi:hypothetical protein